jgi:predicted RNA binding protein YcfA (HicA-like mRNA interferase family)
MAIRHTVRYLDREFAALDRRIPFGTAFAPTFGAMEMSRLSGADCVARLGQLGFIVVRAAFGMTLLKHRDRRVMVPDVESIEPEMLTAILRSADLSESEFFRRPVRSGMYARTREGEILPTGTTKPPRE